MQESRERIEALSKRLEIDGRGKRKVTERKKLTVYLTLETRERIEEVYAEVYYRTRAGKINFLEEVVKAGLADPQRIIRVLKGDQ